jgi:hypothetical protein
MALAYGLELATRKAGDFARLGIGLIDPCDACRGLRAMRRLFIPDWTEVRVATQTLQLPY